MIVGFFDKLKNKLNKKPKQGHAHILKEENENNDKIEKQRKRNFLTYFFNISNKTLAKTDGILKELAPKIYSMAQESNIACKFNENLLCTKDGNLCMGVKLEGVSYSSVNEEEELSLAEARNRFFIRLDESIELNIICKKESIEIENDSSTIKNLYAKEIIEKWDKKQNAYKINYY